MQRILIVDDSAATRARVSSLLRGAGYAVDAVADAAEAAARAIEHPPDAVVTDLVMGKISGVQLCRLLRAEHETARVPVVLLTASDDQRSRFWARSAGATAYLTKGEIDRLPSLLREIAAPEADGAPPASPRGRTLSCDDVEARLSRLLDSALYDAVVTSEVRALASAHDRAALFEGLARLMAGVTSYRWLAVSLDGGAFMVHANAGASAACEREARAALAIGDAAPCTLLGDDRPALTEGAPPIAIDIRFGEARVGRLALRTSARVLGAEDRRLVALAASELGGALRIQSLVDELSRQAVTDALTGLPNRRAFGSVMDRELARCARYGLPLSILVVDVDHFKRVNDAHGHGAGDDVLRGVARDLRASARTTDLVARWGGEEFVVALPHTSADGAKIVAERMRRTIADATYPLANGGTLKVTASFGVASSAGAFTLDDIVDAADGALYRAKARGRNRVEVAPAAESPSAVRGAATIDAAMSKR